MLPQNCDLPTAIQSASGDHLEDHALIHGGKGQSNQYLFSAQVVKGGNRVAWGRREAHSLRAGYCRSERRNEWEKHVGVGEACPSLSC